MMVMVKESVSPGISGDEGKDGQRVGSGKGIKSRHYENTSMKDLREDTASTFDELFKRVRGKRRAFAVVV